MPRHPLEMLGTTDPELHNVVANAFEFAFSEGTLSRKSKLLIALALDVSAGTVDGVKSVAQRAIDAGATKEEIMEVLRVVYLVCGVGSVFPAARALNELF